MADSEEIKRKGGIPEAFPGEEMKDDDNEEALKKQYELEEFKGKKNTLKEKKPEKKSKSRAEKFDDGEDLDDEDFSGNKNLKEDDDSNGDDDDDGDGDGDDDDSGEVELDETIIDRAIDAGMDPEDIEEYSSNEKLLKHVRILERAEKRKSRSNNDDDDGPSKKSSDDNKKPSSKKEGDDEPDFKIDLDPDLYDPKTIETLKNLNKHYHGKISELMGTITQLTERLNVSDEREQKKVLSQTMNEFDSEISKLCSDNEDGEFWKETFGETDHLNVNKKSKFFKNRSEVWTEMKALAKADAELGRHSDLKTLFKKALSSVYSDKLDKKAKFSLSKKIKGSKRTFISRPNQKGSSEKKRGAQAAVDFADNFLKNLS